MRHINLGIHVLSNDKNHRPSLISKLLCLSEPTFLQAFLDHGIEASQIPRLLPQVKFGDLQSSEKLLAAPTPSRLDQTAQLFGICISWLEGANDRIYECRSCYKQPTAFFGHLATLNCNRIHLDDWYVQTLVTSKVLDGNNSSEQPLVVVIVEKTVEFEDQYCYRYHVYGDGWDWGYWPTHI